MSELVMRNIAHEQIGGGYAKGPVYIVDTTEIRQGLFETIVMKPDGSDVFCCTAVDEETARTDFRKALLQYAAPCQRAVIGADLRPGEKYTVLCMNDFGFPVARKIVFISAECATYAQHYDVVKLICKMGRRRTAEEWYLRNQSFAIYEGWRELPDEVTWNTVSKDGKTTVRMSKYVSFDAQYLEDGKKYLTGLVCEYENYKTANGRVYA